MLAPPATNGRPRPSTGWHSCAGPPASSSGLPPTPRAWVLVWAPRDSAIGRATFSADLFSEEPVLLDAFTSVLGARRFFAAAEGDRLEQLLAESASAQAEVTGKLGQQVRQAVELLVGAMSRANRERDGELLAGIEPHQVYEAAVGVLMRCVFLLYAEEQRPAPARRRPL